MAITTGSLDQYPGLSTISGNVYAIADDPMEPNDLVYVDTDTIVPLQPLSLSKDHPLTSPGVGIVNFRPDAGGSGGGIVRPTAGLLY